MTSSDSTPKLPIWVFVATDAVLLGAAALIAKQAAHPLSATSVLSIVACVIVGALVLLIPLVAHYERQKNETLDDRQRALEGLASTLTASAEQISIAANGLHEIAELTQKNLRHAEQLPHKLQDKIAEFQSQLASVNDAEKEELEKELVSLRSSESERLETVATKVAKTAAELAKLETATQQHLASANEAIAKLSMGTAAAIGKAQVAAEQALAQARTEAARGLGEAAGNATRAIESAKSSALNDIDAKLTATGTALIERLSRELSAKLAAPSSPAAEVSSPPPSNAAGSEAPETSVDLSSAAPVKTDGAAHPPKRPRKPRREDAEESASAVSESAATIPPPLSAPISSSPSPAAEEPPPIPSAKIAEVAPVAPLTTQPFSSEPKPAAPDTPAPAAPPPSAADSTPSADHTPASSATEPAKIPRRRAAKQPEPDVTTPSELDLGIQDPPANGTSEKTLTSDGATRLLVTAYIGIGNRLFIRGTGPGLTWEKGIPLQFVSIGKWRWETNDATTPVQFKLYKNDDVECASLGEQSVEVGYQQEVTAAF